MNLLSLLSLSLCLGRNPCAQQTLVGSAALSANASGSASLPSVIDTGSVSIAAITASGASISVSSAASNTPTTVTVELYQDNPLLPGHRVSLELPGFTALDPACTFTDEVGKSSSALVSMANGVLIATLLSALGAGHITTVCTGTATPAAGKDAAPVVLQVQSSNGTVLGSSITATLPAVARVLANPLLRVSSTTRGAPNVTLEFSYFASTALAAGRCFRGGEEKVWGSTPRDGGKVEKFSAHPFVCMQVPTGRRRAVLLAFLAAIRAVSSLNPSLFRSSYPPQHTGNQLSIFLPGYSSAADSTGSGGAGAGSSGGALLQCNVTFPPQTSVFKALLLRGAGGGLLTISLASAMSNGFVAGLCSGLVNPVSTRDAALTTMQVRCDANRAAC